MSARIAPAFAMLALICLGVSACAGDKNTGARPGRASQNRSIDGLSEGYLNDGDAEKINDRDGDNNSGNHDDGDADSSEEYEETYDNGDYHDSDDAGILDYGHSADALVRQQVTAVVERYYAAASAQDGAIACAMMVPAIARSTPEDYGRASGPGYLHGAGTCVAVMTRLFVHDHAHVNGAIAVTGVRVEGQAAYALMGSGTMPASFIALSHEHGTWKVADLIGSALP